MMMPSQVASSFIVVEPQLLFELLVALFYSPSHLGKKDKPAKPCLRKQVGKPIFRRYRLPFGPFDKQPLSGGTLFDVSRSVSWKYSDGCKTRNEPTLSSFAPFNRFPHVGREFESKIFHRKNIYFVRLVIGSRTAYSTPCLPGFIEDNGLGFDFGYVEKLPIDETLPKGVTVPVGAVTNHNTLWDAPRDRLVDQIQGDLPFGLKAISARNTRIHHSQRIVCPSFRKIDLKVDRHAVIGCCQVERHRNLAVSRFAQGARVLTGNPDRVFPLFGKPSIINNPGNRRDHLCDYPFGQLLSNRMVVPGALTDKLLHSLDIAVRQPSSHWLDRLSFAVQKQPANVGITPSAPLQAPYRLKKLRKECFEPAPARL